MINMDNQKIRLDQLLRGKAGSYLKPVVYHSKHDNVCATCGGFKQSQYDKCWSCNQTLHEAQRRGCQTQLADCIACGFYAVEEWGQTYKVIHDYKEQLPSAEEHRTIVASILALHILGHFSCIGEQVNSPVTAWAVIPSTKNSKRYGQEHPLHQLVAGLIPFLPEVTLRANKAKTRSLDGKAFSIASFVEASCLRHVLLIDDSWVTGSTAQSASICLKEAGASRISIYCVTRIAKASFINSLDPGLLRDFSNGDHYTKGWCPWKRCVEYRLSSDA